MGTDPTAAVETLAAGAQTYGRSARGVDEIRYMARTAGGWLPVHFGPWQTIYWWFCRFVRRLLFRSTHDEALMLDRKAAGREASPTGGVLDSQTVKAPFAEVRGFDGGKKIVGRILGAAAPAQQARESDGAVCVGRGCDKLDQLDPPIARQQGGDVGPVQHPAVRDAYQLGRPRLLPRGDAGSAIRGQYVAAAGIAAVTFPQGTESTSDPASSAVPPLRRRSTLAPTKLCPA